MIIIGPVAIAENWVIGGDNDLPWYLPEDLKHFKQITLGKTVLMGRKTYDSILKRLGKPLPDRKNVVITTNTEFVAPQGVLVFNSLPEALNALKDEDVYVIGGAEIFRQLLPLAEKLIITHVHGAYEGDAYFPAVDFNTWEKELEQKYKDYTFAEYVKL